jgi:hypothetical protein
MRMLASIAAGLLVTLPVSAQEQPAGPAPVKPGLLIEAIKDCAAATSPTAVSEEMLLSRGWERAKNLDVPDDPDAYKRLPVRALGKTGGYPFLVFLTAPEKANQCQLMGKLAPEDEKTISITLELAFAPVATNEGPTAYRYGSHAVAFERKGNGLFAVIVIDSGEK